MDGDLEQVNEEGKRVLVHRVDEIQLLDTEEETSSLEGNWFVLSSLFINLLLGDLGLLLLLLDFLREGRGVFKNGDGGLVSENITNFVKSL